MSWKKVRLGDYVNIVSGFAFDSQSFNTDKLGMPLVRIRDVGKNTTETYFSSTYRDEFVIDNGDILVSMDGEFRIAEWKGGKALVNQRVCWLKSKDKFNFDERYMLYCLPNKLKSIENSTSFVTVKHLSVKSINEILIPLPDLQTQKHIASILDKADALRQQNRQLLAYYDALLQSTFIEMFGDPVENPKGWEVVKIRDLITEAKYGTSKPAEESGKFKYMRMNNLTYNGFWDFSSIKYINLENSEIPKYVIRRGDIVFNRTNSKELVGKTAVYNFDEPVAIAGYLIRVRTNEKAVPEYIWGYLNSRYGKATLRNMCKSIVGMANINAQELQDIDIFLANIARQIEYAKIVQHIESQKQQAKSSLAESEALFQGLLASYFGDN
ncbi:restriction endonuclease subunit S [Dyadobacter sp. CY345]|uniref:restriction endonuclease subunit S n=1 Tax=Dyadobacter sp. CY345 TaxID=2909335 RepID=UPI001F23EEA0|nr:restriction endonuclease subunit S [Dyadobacter sp. CY345]MCF2445411.1 restriction endonuclease subunit S [Dyadobacter sp. CY345]